MITRIGNPIIRIIKLAACTLCQFIVQHFLESAESVAVLSADCNRFIKCFWMGIAIRSGTSCPVHFAAAHSDSVSEIWRGHGGPVGVARSAFPEFVVSISCP